MLKDSSMWAMARRWKLSANRVSDVLELIHMDICGPFPTASWNGQSYFITFIDDFSRYGYIYLIHEKSQSLDVFKILRLRWKTNLAKELRPFDLTVVENTMAEMTDQVNNVQDLLLNS